MTNHPNRKRIDTETIRAFLADRYGVELSDVITGAEGDEDQVGLYEGDADAWIVFGTMPNTNEIGWFFAGYSGEIVQEIRNAN